MNRLLILPALLLIVLGCAKATETLHSSGTEQTTEQGDKPRDPETQVANDPLTDPVANEEVATAPQATDDEPTADPPKGLTQDSFVGTYAGAFQEDTIKFVTQMLPESERAKTETQMRNVEITLELQKAGKYKLTTKADKTTEVEQGKWSYDTKTGIVTIEAPEPTKEAIARLKAQGMTDEQIAATQNKSVPCKVSDDGRTLSFEQVQGGMRLGITFTRK